MTPAAVLLAVVGLVQAPVPAVEGVIRSSEGGGPIAYAQVRVLDDTLSDWTDARGEYSLVGLPRGRWHLEVVHTAHDTLDLEVFVPGDRPLHLDITLHHRPAPVREPLYDFEPFQVEYTLPALLNTDEVTDLIGTRYPPDLVRRRVGGEAVLRLWLDERGQVVRSLISHSSGASRLDSIALEVADRMRFRPAKSGDQAVRVIVRIPVFFTVPDSIPSGNGG